MYAAREMPSCRYSVYFCFNIIFFFLLSTCVYLHRLTLFSSKPIHSCNMRLVFIIESNICNHFILYHVAFLNACIYLYARACMCVCACVYIYEMNQPILYILDAIYVNKRNNVLRLLYISQNTCHGNHVEGVSIILAYNQITLK